MNLLFSMSLAGSLVFILYLIINPITKRYLPASWRYRFLKVSLLFYLLPYQYYKYIYIRIIRSLSHRWQENIGSGYPISANKIILVDSEGHLYFKNQTVIFTILGIWGGLVTISLLYRLIKYVYCMRDLRQISKLLVTMSDKQRMSKRQPRAEVTLFANQYITTPFTIGLFSPRIVLPASLADRKESQMIIAHEMAHVRNRDNLVKFLWLLVMCLHWYNPLVYLLYREICRISEQVCDASVVQDMSEQEKKQYQSLIIELGQKNPQTDTLLASPFSGRFRMIKERITIMNRTFMFSKKISFVISLAVVVVILALSPISVLAYSPAHTLGYLDEEFFLGDELLDSEPYSHEPFQDYGIEHDIFVADDGQVYIIENSNPQLDRAICLHDWKDGKIYTHAKNDDDSCVVYCYDCQLCSLCNAYKNATYNSEHKYLKCPH